MCVCMVYVCMYVCACVCLCVLSMSSESVSHLNDSPAFSTYKNQMKVRVDTATIAHNRTSAVPGGGGGGTCMQWCPADPCRMVWRG